MSVRTDNPTVNGWADLAGPYLRCHAIDHAAEAGLVVMALEVGLR